MDTTKHSLKVENPMLHEMVIPKSRSGTVLYWIMTSIVVFFVLLSVANLICGVSMVASGLWIVFVTFMVRSSVREAHGVHRYLTNLLGGLAGRQFVESAPEAEPAKEVRFGFLLFGHRFIRETVALDRIESVEWSTGQATSMAGHDMNDWSICLWYVLDEATSKSRPPNRTKNRWLVIVGPARRKQETEALGLSFVTFLRNVGVALIEGENEARFVRGGQADRMEGKP